MNLSKLVSTKEREAILVEILPKKDKISVAETARNLGISKGFVSRYLAILKKEKILKKTNGDYFIDANLDVRLLRIILSLKHLRQLRQGREQRGFRYRPLDQDFQKERICARRTLNGSQEEVQKCEPAVSD
jgi:predicted transcriptional regulator